MTTQTKSTSYKKRIISFLVFLSLLVSLFPAMPIYASGAPAEQVINFCSKRGTPADFTLETDGWQVDTTNTSAAIPGRTDNWIVYADSFMKAQMAMGEAVVVDFKLENAGTYDVTVSGWQLNSLGIVGAFSIDGINVGSFDFSYSDPSGSDDNASAKIGTISLEAGIHKMRILRTNTDSGGALLFLSNVKFTPAESAAPAEQYVDFCVPSGSKSPSAFVKELDGWEVDSANTTAPQSGDNYVVQIDPYGLKVVMNSNERIVLDFNVARDGVYDVTIRGSQFNGLGLDGKFLIDGVPVGEYSFHCTESSNAGFEKTIGSIALTGGTHKLTIYRTDSTSSGYMFIAGMRLTPVTLSTGIAQTCSFLGGSGLTLPEHAQLNLHGWSLNAAKTAETIPTRTGNYEVGATSGIKAEFASGETMTLNFNVGVEGFYQVDITGWKVQNYGILGSIAIDGTPLGTYDFSDLATSSVLTDVTETLGKIALSAGTHELSITKADPNGNRDGTAGGFGYMWLTGISLTPTTPDPVSEDMKFTMSLENASGEAQEHFNPGDIIYVKALLNGAGSYQFGAVQADVSYDNTKLELVEDETTAGDSITINKSYAADTVRMAYGGAAISASAPYTLATIALRVKRGIETGDSVISYANTNVSKYNNSEWAASTAENAAAKLHNITVSFTQGENGAMSTSTFYAKYIAPRLL